MKRETSLKTLTVAAFVGFIFCFGASMARAQTTTFTYQGKLSDGAAAAGGTYDLGFALYDAETGGTQIGTALTRSNVSVMNGVFTVQLDFGAVFPGANRFLQIAVKKTTETNFTTLTPRQPLTATPYAIQSLTANSANTANTATTATNSQQLGGVAASNYLRTTGSGANLRDLNASTITSGTLDDEFLSANVARRDIPNTFVGSQTFNRNISQTGDTTNLNLTNGFVARGALDTGAIPVTGAGVRMMFYPRKAAFRAGQVDADQWDDANVGALSAAFGFNSRATNRTAFATGNGSLASGQSSIALGVGTTASAEGAVALGYQTTASRQGSTALGFGSTASGNWSVALGYINTSSGLASTALGASSTASGNFSIAFGTNTTASGDNSTAMGSLASTNGKEGAFVYGDYSSDSAINAVADNEFAVRAAGGFRFRTNSLLTTGCNLPASSGSFSCTSSRDLKENFLDIKGGDVLAKLRRIPVMEWSYKNESNNVRHIGAFAEDFYREFKLGTDDKSIGLLDIAGVNTAAIKELDGEMQNNAALIKTLRTENDALKSELENQQKQIDGLKIIVCAMKPDAEVCRDKKN